MRDWKKLPLTEAAASVPEFADVAAASEPARSLIPEADRLNLKEPSLAANPLIDNPGAETAVP